VRKSVFDPPPPIDSKVYPCEVSPLVVPSYIGDPDCVLNCIPHIGTGSKLHDWSGNRNNGLITDAVWQDGPFGWSLYYNGASAFADCGDNASLLVSSEHTVECWIRLENTGGNQCPVVKSSFILQVDNTRKFAVYQGAVTTWPSSNSGVGLINWGEWTHIAVTYNDATDRAFHTFLNGQDVTNIIEIAVGGLNGWGFSNLFIGCDHVAARWCQGNIAVVRIYARAFSTDEIKRHFERTRGLFGV